MEFIKIQTAPSDVASIIHALFEVDIFTLRKGFSIMRRTSFLVIILCLVMPTFIWAADQSTAPQTRQQEVAQASPPKGPPQALGFSGGIALGAIWIHTDSQLIVDDSNEDTSLNDNDAFDKYWPLVFLDLKYTTGSGTQFYFGTPLEEAELAFKIGVGQELGRMGRMDLYITPGFGKVWQDPYMTSGKREETDKFDWTVGIEWDRIGGTGAKLAYTVKSVDIDDDVIGDRIDTLKRNGNIHTIESEYAVKLGRGLILSPGLSLIHANMDGAANRYHGYGAQLSLKRFTPKYFFLATLSCNRNQYDEMHPIFNKTREETVRGGFTMLTWFSPFGLDNWSVTGGLGYFRGEANLDFFDATTTISMITVGYKF
jgi:hypothetical protein